MKTINTGYCDFEKLVTGGFVSVDKTAQIYELDAVKTEAA